MSFQLQMEQMPGYLAARFTGTGEPGEGSRQFESIAENCKLTKNNKLLIDITGYYVKASFLDRFFFGEKLQAFARRGIKVAFVDRPDRIEPRKFGVMVGQNRGVNASAFTDLQP